MQVGTDAFLAIEAILGGCGIAVSAAEADGRLLSLATMLGSEATTVWLSQLADDADAAPSEEALDRLQALAVGRIATLEGAEGLPDLCLPGDDDDIRDRVDSLAAWASGFLSGLGEAAALRGESAQALLEAAPLDELLADLGDIARAGVDDELDDGEEAAESAYAELVEYLRVAAQLSYETLAPVRALDGPGSARVH